MGKQSTFREDYRKAFRLLNLVRTMDASILPQSILQAMLEAWSPYVSLFFTARLIDRLMAGNFQAAAWSALWLLGSSLILGLLTDYFSSRRNLLGNQIFHGLTRLLREKAMDLNYATISDPDVAKSVTSTEQFSRFHGGLFGLVTQFQSLLKSMLSALTALVLIVSLCLAPTRNGGLLTVLCSPMPNLISLGLVVGGTCYLSSRVNRRYQSQEHQNSVEHVDAENGLSYLLMHVFCNIDAGKVIRLYDMGDMLKENYRRYMDIARPVYVKMCKS